MALEPPGPRLRAELARRAGIEVTADAAEAAFRAEISYYLAHHLEGRDASSLDALRDRCAGVIAETLGLGGSRRAEVREAMLTALRFEAQPDAAPALRELRAAGARLVVASNWDCSLGRVLEGAGLALLLDGVVSSAEVGAAKPEPAVLEAALALAGVGSAEAVHVGDSIGHDVEGARAAGVRAILLDRSDESARAGVAVIRSLRELPSLLF